MNTQLRIQRFVKLSRALRNLRYPATFFNTYGMEYGAAAQQSLGKRAIKLFSADSDGVRNAGEMLRQGSCVAFPTETVYGLGANALDEDAVLSVFRHKGRPLTDPLIVHLPDQEKALSYLLLAPPVRVSAVRKQILFFTPEAAIGLTTRPTARRSSCAVGHYDSHCDSVRSSCALVSHNAMTQFLLIITPQLPFRLSLHDYRRAPSRRLWRSDSGRGPSLWWDRPSLSYLSL